MRASSATTSAESTQNFTERYGGWILSGCLHIMLFAALLMARQMRTPLPRDFKSDPIRVSLTTPADAAAEAATAAPAAVEPPAPAPEAAPAITVMPAEKLDKLPPSPPPAEKPADTAAEDNSLAAALKPAVSFQPAVAALPLLDTAGKAEMPGDGVDRGNAPYNPAAGGSTEPGPGSPDGTYAQGSRSKRGDGVYGEGTGAGSAAVGGRIMAARADLVAQKTLFAPKSIFSGRGASEGAIRSIDLGGVDGERAKEVLARYGIKILAAGAGGTSARELATGHTEGQAQFVTRFSSGALAFFQFSSIAANRMAQLEDAALRKEGLDPANIRIVKVTFCVVPTKGGYDLGVMEMKTEPLRVPPSKETDEGSESEGGARNAKGGEKTGAGAKTGR